MKNNDEIIQQTASWVERVVIGCGFCPFAASAFAKNSIHYEVVHSESKEDALFRLLLECQRLDLQPELETTLVILPAQFDEFDDYLELVALTEGMLVAHGYEGVYQVASFHPEYLFAESTPDDPANYTNRSPYPMIHLLREVSVAKAVEGRTDVGQIPLVNVAFARRMGLEKMKRMRDG